jgi:hypothetical protein
MNTKTAIIAVIMTVALCASAQAESTTPPPWDQSCGPDSHQVRVGMTLERVKQCWTHFRMFRAMGQAMRGNVTVTVYEMPYDSRGDIAAAIGVGAIYVVDGKVVAWTQ